MQTCASCGRENPSDARFCNSCAAPLLSAPEHPREERKIVTVFFADLVGFTQRAETLDPEDVRALLSPYWDHVRAELERFGGTVEKFIGDAVMALFGAPVAHEDDPERAVRAALEIRDWARDERVQIRIAVTTGEALVRLDARPDLGEGMATGDVVNTAARLQAAAPVNSILVSEPTYRATRQQIDYRPAAPVVAKGKREPVPVWEALDARARFGVDVDFGQRTPVVGREREVDDLRAVLSRVRNDRAPQLVTLIGVPGIGKSRLVRELFDIVENDPELVLWRQGRSLPYGESASFWALAEMIKAQAGILETDSATEAERKLEHAVAEAVEEEGERTGIVMRLRPLVGLPTEEHLTGDRRLEFYAAWRRFLEALAERRPLVLVFEDLHWADDELLDFVDHLVDWATDVPLLVVATARPELLARRPSWGGGKRNSATVSLAPLNDADTARLFGRVLGRAVLAADLQEQLLARAGGNPLFAEQYARMLAERGEGSTAEVPETVQGVIAARLDALHDDEKRLLQDAAVLGKVFWLGAAAEIGAGARSRTEELLHELERKEFVQRARRSSVAGESEYAFRHVLVRDVAYNQIPRATRATKHRLAAQWIASLGRTDDHADLLAHHYTSALELARASGSATRELEAAARQALIEAGDRAAALNSLLAAAGLYTAALELSTPDGSDYARLLLRLARAQHAADVPGDALGLAVEALLAAGDVDSAAEASARLAHATWMGGDRATASQHLERALQLVDTRPPSPEKAYVFATHARFLMVASRHAEAAAAGATAREMAEELGLAELRAQILVSVGASRVFSGDVVGGIADLEAGLAACRELNSVDAVRGHVNLGSTLWDLGRCAEARAYHERGLELGREFGSVWATIWLRAELALDRFHAGEWDVAQADADWVIAAAETTPTQMEMAARETRGMIAGARGDLDFALVEISRARTIALGTGDPQAVYPTVAELAYFQLDTGRQSLAVEAADELLGLLSAAPVMYQPTDWALVLALVLHRLGRVAELSPHIRAAVVRTPWTDAVEAVIADDLGAAADIVHAIGDLANEARLRLAAADDLRVAGKLDAAQRQLAPALSFFRSVGATACVRRAEALLPATA